METKRTSDIFSALEKIPKGATLEFLKKHWHLLALLGIFLASLWIHTLPLRNIENYMPDIDVYYVYRLSNMVATDNFVLPSNDVLRFYPSGINPKDELIGTYFFPAVFYVVTSKIIPISFLDFAKLLPAILAALAVIPVYLFGKELSGSKTTGLLTAFFFAVSVAMMFRLVVGELEKEGLSVLFFFLTLFFFVRAMKKDSLFDGILAGLSLAIFGLTWGGFQFVLLALAAFVFILLFVNKAPMSLLKAYAPTVLIGVTIPALQHWGLTTSFILFNYLALAVLVIRIYVEKFKLIAEKNLAFIAPLLYTLGGLILIFGSMFSKTLANLFTSISKYLFYSQYIGALGRTVAEDQPTGWGEFTNSLGVNAAQGTPLSFLGPILPLLSLWLLSFIGVFFILYKMHKKKDFSFGLSILLALISTLSYVAFYRDSNMLTQGVFIFSFIILLVLTARKDYSATFALILFYFCLLGVLSRVRFLYILGPFAGLITAYLLSGGISYVSKVIHGKKHLKDKILNVYTISAAIVLVLVLSANFAAGYAAASSFGPSYNANWDEAMKFMKDKTPQESVILSWWDFGYWFQLKGERATVMDGGNAWGQRNTEAALFFTGRMNETQQKEYLQRYGVTHLLVDASMIGKYSAMSLIATDGAQVESFMTFGRQGVYPKDNKTVVVYSSGSYSIWVPLSANGTIDGYIILSTPQGEGYIKGVCTSRGVMFIGYPEGKTAIEGCVFLTSQYAMLASELMAGSVFSRLYLMDGEGLDYVEKVFDNGEVKIFDVKLEQKSKDALLAEWKSLGCKNYCYTAGSGL